MRKYRELEKEFQSTPPRGWRHLRFAFPLLPVNFNPLHREGGDGNHSPVRGGCMGISIHSTARVETEAKQDFDNKMDISIHSTARVETGYRLCKAKSKNFNPLHREGGDSI